MDVAHSGDKGAIDERYWGIFIGMGSFGVWSFGTKTWLHPTACRLQCWDNSGQTIDGAGTQPYSSSYRLLKVFLKPQLPLDFPHDPALLTRGPRPSSIITEMKNKPEGISSRINEAEE